MYFCLLEILFLTSINLSINYLFYTVPYYIFIESIISVQVFFLYRYQLELIF